ncbi:hypothetical protein [Psychroserpens sp.]|uniref:hypothetical protein n=1 Tax=Psychroserpens sp. TaxID=2020870 RepID=UPI001B088DAD|nr:hypothetical protein [Psychroserpens sp.]MBO6607321.1 hypothetical protein [Psychroserpens sp.]MBO6632101.1 hypothetical protein [Psychroserpens sp.]MBO6654603.1 hypothetical protein [Psychroserpens sp.]MBO6681050.1 hypothetical protein [Psychroserpens sp.]MBO6749995.1 hypothetical protein [Psychroserpens sp.]
MSARRLLFILALIVFVVTLVLLVTGSKWLVISLSDTQNIPSGTFITWLGLIALPASIILGINGLYFPKNKRDRLFKKIMLFAVILAILWVPISYLLAGNLSFSFTEKAVFQGGQDAMHWFWRYTYGIPIFSLGTFLLYGILSAFRKKE